ncbi:GNAT family N-acetyltransferase [Proteobacteria bacterium 005FR1]|nr:GNAT family N-acetyltransferase [Proteobacteria bacterium 005FR1]
METHVRKQGSLELLPLEGNLERVETTWKYLQSKYPHSFFTSWGWMETWLQSHAPQADIRCVIGYRNTEPRFIFFVGLHSYRKSGILPTRSAHLNATGIPALDGITIEYNSVLGDFQFSDFIEMFTQLKPLEKYEEFEFPGASDDFVQLVRRQSEPFFYTSNEQPSYYVDLSMVRDEEGDFLKLLSSNKRQQIRRTLREYEREGPVRHTWATTVDEALDMFDEMGTLHTAAWQQRGKQGSFANPDWVRFHKQLIRSRFGEGEIHISKVSNEAEVIGYLYGFIYEGSFLFCQCGLNYQSSNKKRPGLLSHYLLIKHFAEEGLRYYDFLAGEGDYKQSLSTHKTRVSWVSLQRRKAGLRVARVAKMLVMKGRRLLKTA